ncbi:MAG: MoaD/ThiS family protein [Thermoprotei archaeon]|nr:MoaD/ThiS family protein [Thermoprotei archaeon]
MEERGDGAKILLGGRREGRPLNVISIQVRLIPEPRLRQMRVPSGSTVLQVLRLLKLNPEEVVVLKDKVPITEDDVVHEGDILEIVRVTSGG